MKPNYHYNKRSLQKYKTKILANKNAGIMIHQKPITIKAYEQFHAQLRSNNDHLVR